MHSQLGLVFTTKMKIEFLVFHKSSNSMPYGMFCNAAIWQIMGYKMVILHEVKLVPEAIAEGTNGRIVISQLATSVYKHIPIAQSIAEHCNFF